MSSILKSIYTIEFFKFQCVPEIVVHTSSLKLFIHPSMSIWNYATALKDFNDTVNKSLSNIMFYLLKILNQLNIEFLI